MVKLTVDGFLWSSGVVLAAFSSFLWHKPILYAKPMAICECLELATQFGYSVLEVESDSATLVSWINSHGSCAMGICLYFGSIPHYVFCRFRLGQACSREAISTPDFMANWACTHRVHQCFLSPQAFLSAYLGLLICKHSKYLMLGVRFYLSFCFYYFIIFSS